jgi:hypothetical protein
MRSKVRRLAHSKELATGSREDGGLCVALNS